MTTPDLVLRLALLSFLVFPIGQPAIRASTIALAILGVLFARVRNSGWLWLALFAIATARVVTLWPLADNHAYLLAYLCLAIGLSRFAPDPERTLAVSSRWLVAGVFAFAVLWKLALSDDFTSGVFFRVTLLADDRFSWLAELAGVDSVTLAAAREHFQTGLLGASLPAGAARVDALAGFLTWATLAIESAVAAAFLWPHSDRVARVRCALLAFFCATTYAIAPVAGFGWILLCLGLAQLPESSRRVRIGLLVGFGLMIAYDQFLPIA